jgi:hypothetical protein
MGSKKIEYFDKWIISALTITLTIIFVLLGYIENGDHFRVNITTISVNLFYTLISIILLRGTILLLDRYLPWYNQTIKRFIIQVFITLITYLIIQSYILYYLEANHLNNSKVTATTVGTYFVGSTAVILINCLYLMLFLNHSNKTNSGIEKSIDFLNAKLGSKRVNILTKDLRYIFIENGVVRALDKDNRKLVLQDSLGDLEKMLISSFFYRANRQTIISKPIIKEVQYNDNKSCTVALLSIPNPVVISRHKASSFKKWLNASEPTTEHLGKNHKAH